MNTATDVGFTEMRIAKAVGLRPAAEVCQYVVLADGEARREGDSGDAALMRRALGAPPMTIRTGEDLA